jgi:hypothetical protein
MLLHCSSSRTSSHTLPCATSRARNIVSPARYVARLARLDALEGIKTRGKRCLGGVPAILAQRHLEGYREKRLPALVLGRSRLLEKVVRWLGWIEMNMKMERVRFSCFEFGIYPASIVTQLDLHDIHALDWWR